MNNQTNDQKKFEQKEATGALFINKDKGDNPNRPDYKGSLQLNGKQVKMSGWLNKKKVGGEQYIKIKFEEVEPAVDWENAPPAKVSGFPSLHNQTT